MKTGPFFSKLRQAWLLASGVIAMAGRAQAMPVFSVSAQGSCPSKAELATALAAKGDNPTGPNDPSKYSVVTRSEPSGAVLVLIRGDGEQILERHFSSSDCRALADAMAVVIEAYFVEVGELQRRRQREQGREDGAADSEVQNAARVRVETATVTEAASRAGAATLVNRAPSTGAATLVDRASSAGAIPAPAPTRGKAVGETPVPLVSGQIQLVPSPPPAYFARAFVGLGPALALSQLRMAPEVELGCGIDVAAVPLSAELALTTSWGTFGTRPDRVWRWANHGLIRIGVPWGRRARYRPWVGLGVMVARAQGQDLPQNPLRTTVAPLAAAGFETAWPMARGWLARLNAGCVLVTIQEVYRVEPEGEIGRGPRVVCTSTVGIAWGTVPLEQ